ncbi:MAG: type II toxin-antitoxin system HicB family antitoxin [Hydrogenothermaceae bacterium]
MGIYNIPVVIEKDENGYFAYYPTIQESYTQGENIKEIRKNLEEVVRLHILDRLEKGEEIPIKDFVLFDVVEVDI